MRSPEAPAPASAGSGCPRRRKRSPAGQVRFSELQGRLQDSGSRFWNLRVDRVMGRAMADSRSRALALVPVTVEPDEADVAAEVAAELVGEPGLAEVVTLQRRRAAEVSVGDEQSLFVDTLAEYQWARDVAGLAASTLDKLIQPIVEICQYYGVVPWRLTPRQVDRYFAGPGKRGRSTLRQDQPHRRLFRVPRAALRRRDRPPVRGRGGLPIDPFNRPRHRGEFGLRVPPSQQALREFFWLFPCFRGSRGCRPCLCPA